MNKKCFIYGWLLFVCFWNIKCVESAGAQVNMKEDFEDFLSSIESDFYSFEDSINKVFADYLEQTWQEFTVYEGRDFPVYAGNISSFGTKDTAMVQSYDSFYGSHLFFPNVLINDFSLSDLSEKKVADGWRGLGTVDFTSFFRTYKEYAQQFCLNDWGNYLLLKYATQQLCYSSFTPSEQLLLLYYLLSNVGYKAKIGRVENEKLVLLLPFMEEVYKIPFIKVGEKKYYIMDISSRPLKKIYTVMSDFPKADKILSLHILEALDFPISNVTCEFKDKRYLPLSLNRNLLDFYATYPLCDLSVYFRSVPSKVFTESMDNSIKKYLKGKTQSEQVSWLLNFVQQMFTHKPDMDVHKTEVYYFPEEMVFYPYTDCEDLSVFLSWLLCRYVTDEVLVLYYPTHVAIAVERYEGYQGEIFKYQNKEYLICDPSYRGAVPGKVIPACVSLRPIVVSYSK
ncbi:MAG: hypothetical protein IJD84_04090 [Parabacteroides sp.]|nr:hypothetical protein [Parabacteroides sp.]